MDKVWWDRDALETRLLVLEGTDRPASPVAPASRGAVFWIQTAPRATFFFEFLSIFYFTNDFRCLRRAIFELRRDLALTGRQAIEEFYPAEQPFQTKLRQTCRDLIESSQVLGEPAPRRLPDEGKLHPVWQARPVPDLAPSQVVRPKTSQNGQ